MSDAYNRVLKAWAKEYSAEYIDARVNKLINLATMDLYHGPYAANDEPATDEYGNENEWAGYPGFVSACEEIRERGW